MILRTETMPVQAAQNGNAVEVRIYADAGANQVDGIQFRLNYDPSKLQAADADGQAGNGVNLQTSPAFAKIVQNVVNPTTGVASYAASREVGQGPATGTILLGSLW
ncbi:MAG: cohesin domain-containing protein, partial [Chloroflexi bacterium]|nr:cohesin domain-containing protein [Chloroflexota bacterium]